jgi:hypothetical protein
MRSVLGLAASALAGLAAIVADLDGSVTPFFIGLTFFAGLEAWAAHSPFAGARRSLARGIALVWLVAAVWIGVLLVMYTAACGCSYPTPPPTVYYAGLPGTAYHLAGLYGGLVLVLVSAFAPERWFVRRGATPGTP